MLFYHAMTSIASTQAHNMFMSIGKRECNFFQMALSISHFLAVKTVTFDFLCVFFRVIYAFKVNLHSVIT